MYYNFIGWNPAFVLFVLFLLTCGIGFIVRDHTEGVAIDSSYASRIGSPALIFLAFNAALVFQARPKLVIEPWLIAVKYQIVLLLAGLCVGALFHRISAVARSRAKSPPLTFTDSWNNFVTIPSLTYVTGMSVPFIYLYGSTRSTGVMTILLLIFIGCLVIDIACKRLNQPTYIAAMGWARNVKDDK